MRKLQALTVGILALAVGVMAFAGLAAQKVDATSSLCHSSTLSITAASSVKAGKRLTVTGSEPQSPAHTVKATLQYKKASASSWKNGASVNLSGASYSLKWKAPSAKGKYKIRVRVTHSGASNTSATKTVRVK